MEALPNPPEQLTLGAQLGGGVFGRVYRASDATAVAGAVEVAVKVCSGAGAGGARGRHALAELAAMRAARHPNLVLCHAAYLDTTAATGGDVWFVMELCSCSALELVRARLTAGTRMEEDHIAFILKETIKALIYLHENKIIHGNVRCSNVLLNYNGEVKLSDFALSRGVTGELGKRHTGIGSPAWMAPEVVAASDESGGGGDGYDARADVWALGVTAIELAEGRAPHQGMHPTRALFHITRNPPPTLEKPSNSSQLLNDFIEECLVKNPEHRPFVVELLEHPFIRAVPENDFHLTQELKKLSMEMKEKKSPNEKVSETIITNGLLWKEGSFEPEALQVEDLASLADISEESVLSELQRRWQRGDGAVYIGDTLLALNPPSAAPDMQDQCSDVLHEKYECASLADNAPHVFGVADGAYQRALHHREPQHLVLCGESGSGKSTLAALALRHLAHLGRVRARADLAARLLAAAAALRLAAAAASATRALHRVTVTYSASGKLSGAVFAIHLLDKWRVSSTDMSQANFDLLYFFYDAMEAEKQLETYKLEPGRAHRYLRVHGRPGPERPAGRGRGARYSPPADNAASYAEFRAHLSALQWEADELDALQRLLAAVLVLGNVRFRESGEVANPETAARVADLLRVDCAKLTWALLNYCAVEEGAGRAARRRRGSDAARDARDSLAAALYARLVDSLVNRINHKLSLSRAVFGDPISITIVDMFGFESFRRNRLEQLIVNTTNEQLHFLYCQRTFAWERRDARDDGLDAGGEEHVEPRYYDNRAALEQLMGRPLGVFYVVDGASRLAAGVPSTALQYITSSIRNARCGPHVRVAPAGGAHEFCVAHYAGRVTYDAREMADTNRDLLPPELVLALRASSCAAVRALFDAKLTRTGNLVPPSAATTTDQSGGCGGGDHALWSQTRGVRTAAAVYRATSLDLLRQLSGDGGGGGSGVHFVRCVRADLALRPDTAALFRVDLVRHQLRALAVVEAARARKHGFSCRLPFADFLRRYKFLAFDFDERVEETCDNCRLLLLRLKLEGWRLGRTRVFLKYYHEEYLARLYENKVKKIVKVQSMMRAFLARKAKRDKAKVDRVSKPETKYSTSEEEAAALIQKAYRGYVVRRAYGPLVTQSGNVDEDTARLLRRFAARWRSRSVFQVLLQYRAAAHQRLVHFSQQVHIYNQATVELLGRTSAPAPLERVVARAPPHDVLPLPPPAVWKLPFRLNQLAFRDTADLCADTAEREADSNREDLEMESWDEPLRSLGGGGASEPEATAPGARGSGGEALIYVPFCREQAQPPPGAVEVEPSEVTVTGASRAPHYRPPAPWRAPPAPDADPVRELQARAAASRPSAAAGDDDAPYNFQAMLRRTPRNRASMKRSGEAEAAAAAETETAAAAAVAVGRARPRLQLAPGVAVLLEGEVAHV